MEGMFRSPPAGTYSNGHQHKLLGGGTTQMDPFRSRRSRQTFLIKNVEETGGFELRIVLEKITINGGIELGFTGKRWRLVTQ
ncbi:hypothetical protein L1887_07644 [Cichorium endivia]|nr:hypothetical protein L1887_07644 [Cichorium endivia]